MTAGIPQYIKNIPKSRKERFNSIVKLIRTLFPDSRESMDFKMPTFRLGDGWISIANQKNYISVYTCSPEHINSFKEKNPKIKTGKGCINIMDRDKLVIEDLKDVVKSALSRGE